LISARLHYQRVRDVEGVSATAEVIGKKFLKAGPIVPAKSLAPPREHREKEGKPIGHTWQVLWEANNLVGGGEIKKTSGFLSFEQRDILLWRDPLQRDGFLFDHAPFPQGLQLQEPVVIPSIRVHAFRAGGVAGLAGAGLAGS